MNDFDDILDILVRHRIYLQRLSASHAAEIAKRIGAGSRDKAALIRDHLEEVLAKGKFTRTQAAALGRMQADLKKALGGNFEAAQEWYVKELDELITHEVATTQKVVGSALTGDKVKALSSPTPAALARLKAATPYSGYTIDQWFKGTESAEINKIMARVRVGIAGGESMSDMVRAIRGTRESGYTDGILQGYTTTSAQTMARTITNGVSNATQQEFYKANAKLIDHEVFTATLDGRTSTICASLDGEAFDVGDGPVPPLHPNCRSLRVPVTKAMAEDGLLGDRPYVRDADTRRERETRFRREAKADAGNKQWSRWSEKERRAAIARHRRSWQKANIGTTAAKTNYETWLKRQPAWFQKEVLGPSRYKLFKKGGLKLGSFVDHNNQRYTLKQLKKIEGAAFRRAGL